MTSGARPGDPFPWMRIISPPKIEKSSARRSLSRPRRRLSGPPFWGRVGVGLHLQPEVFFNFERIFLRREDSAVSVLGA